MSNAFAEQCFRKLGISDDYRPSFISLPYTDLHRLFADLGARIAIADGVSERNLSRAEAMREILAEARLAIHEAASEALGKLDVTALADRVEQLVETKPQREAQRNAEAAQRDAEVASAYLKQAKVKPNG